MESEKDSLLLSQESTKMAVHSFRNRLPDLTLMDDYYLMLYAKRYPEDFAMILSEFMEMPIELEAKTFRIQEVILSPDDAKDVRFDITVNTKRNDRIVLEVENRKKFGELRLRYYMAKQDAWLLEKGKTYKELPDAYNIVVARHDIKGDGEPRYIMRMCYVKSLEEVGGNPSIVPDGKAAIYINAAYENEDDHSPLANLIHDFKCNDPEKMKNEILRKHSGILKQTKDRII